jgi:hypothetical protein
VEGVDFLLSYINHHDIFLYHMGVKSVFLNGTIHDLVFVKQLLLFEDSHVFDHVYVMSRGTRGSQISDTIFHKR